MKQVSLLAEIRTCALGLASISPISMNAAFEKSRTTYRVEDIS